MDTITDIDLDVPVSPSLVMRDLADCATLRLPFLAAVDVQPHSRIQQPHTPQKRISYILLSKGTMPMLVELFLRFKANVDVYVDRTSESVLSVRIISRYYTTRRENWLSIV
jgi:hypothetical protein